MASVAMSNMVSPAMNRVPSGYIESTEDAPIWFRFCSTTPNHFVNEDVGGELVGVMTPTMCDPSGYAALALTWWWGARAWAPAGSGIVEAPER